MGPLTITSFKAEHVPALVAIEEACFANPWRGEALLALLEKQNAVVLVGMLGGIVVGYIHMQYFFESGDIVQVAVLAEHRGKGYGTQLLQALLHEASVLEVQHLLLEVRLSNQSARYIYEKSGFIALGQRKNYYANPVEDALLLRKEL